VLGNDAAGTSLVGHSVGCQAILRYIARLPGGTKIGRVVLVAPWLKLSETVMQDQAYGPPAKEWLETPIDWEKVRSNAGPATCFFSKDDPYVPIENAEMFREKLGAEIIIED